MLMYDSITTISGTFVLANIIFYLENRRHTLYFLRDKTHRRLSVRQ